MRSWNRRQRALGLLLFTAVLLLAVTVSGALLTDRATAADFSRTNLAPGPDGLFGTTKADQRAHGFGLRGMREIAARYGGTLEAAARDGKFELVACLPLAENRTE